MNIVPKTRIIYSTEVSTTDVIRGLVKSIITSMVGHTLFSPYKGMENPKRSQS